MADFNIDLKFKGIGFNKLDEFCDLLVSSQHTCFTKSQKSLINLSLTDNPLSFPKNAPY